MVMAVVQAKLLSLKIHRVAYLTCRELGDKRVDLEAKVPCCGPIRAGALCELVIGGVDAPDKEYLLCEILL